MRNLLIINSILVTILTCFVEDKNGLIFGIYVLFFVLYMGLIFSPSTKKLSLKIRQKHPVLYEKYKGRSYFFSDLKSVEFYRFTKSEMLTIVDKELCQEIYQNVKLFKTSSLIFGITIIILISLLFLKN